MFTPLTIQSAFSLNGTPHLVSDYVKQAAEKGYTTIVLNEVMTMASALMFYRDCQKYGVTPIIAMTFQFEGHTISAAAQSTAAYKELVHLASVVNCQHSVDLRCYSELRFWIIQVDEENYEQLKSQVPKNRLFGVAVNKKQCDDYQQKNITPLISKETLYLKPEDVWVKETLNELREKTREQQAVLPHEGEDYLYTANDYKQYLIVEFGENALLQTESALQSQMTLQFETKMPEFTPDADRLLKQLAIEGLQKKSLLDSEHEERLYYELDVIAQMGFSDYFLMMWDVVQFTKRENITLGAGRGSAAASLVLYALEVTNIDPLQYDLVFERFLNPERYTMPDVDLDLPDNRRYDVMTYVQQKYGEQKVAQIGTYQTYGPKGAIRDIAKLYGQASWELERWSSVVKELSDLYYPDENTLKWVNHTPTNQVIFKLAQKIATLPKNVSKHAAGIVISHEPINRHIPVYLDESQFLVTQYVMSDVEASGMLKMDFLGVRHLTVLAQAQQMIQQFEPDFSIWSINFSDEKTLALFQKGDTDGVFQFDSRGIRSLLQRVKPQSLAEIATVNALYRPGPMDQSAHYYKRKFDEEPITYIHEALRSILQETYGIIVYQEQIMKIAHDFAGFSLGQADILRRAISKKNSDAIANQKANFISGAVAKGYTIQVAEQIFQYIEKFAEYGFAKSHAYAYAVFAYQMAYIKANYPEIYYLTLLSKINARSEKFVSYIVLAMQQGIQFQLPNINLSRFYAHLSAPKTIQLGLSNILGLRKDVINHILEERKTNGAFTSLENFINRSDDRVKIDTVEKLIYAGAFDFNAHNRATMINSLEKLWSNKAFQLSLPLSIKLDAIAELPKHELEAKELQLLGFAFSANDFEKWLPYYRSNQLQRTSDLQLGQTVTMLGRFKTIRKIFTKKNERMAFMKFEDRFGKIDAVVFPNVYTKVVSLLDENQLVVIKGKVDVKETGQCIVSDIVTVDTFLDNLTKKTLYLKLASRQQLHELLPILKSQPGKDDVVVYFEDEKKYHALPKRNRIQFDEALKLMLIDKLGENAVVFRELKREENT